MICAFKRAGLRLQGEMAFGNLWLKRRLRMGSLHLEVRACYRVPGARCKPRLGFKLEFGDDPSWQGTGM
jgi:hypothetical protein